MVRSLEEPEPTLVRPLAFRVVHFTVALPTILAPAPRGLLAAPLAFPQTAGGSGAVRSARLRLVDLVGYGLQTGGHLHEVLPDHVLGYEFGEPPTMGGLLAENFAEVNHRTSR